MSIRKVVNFPETRVTDLEIQNLELVALELGQSLSDVMFTATEKERGFLKLLRSTRESFEEHETALGVIQEAICQLNLRFYYDNLGLRNRREDMSNMLLEVERWQKVQESLGEPNGIFSFLKWLRTKDI